MSETLTPESFASLLSGAETTEQPQAADSEPAQLEATEEGMPDAETAAEPEAQAEGDAEDSPPDQPETESERVIKWQTASGETVEATESELKAGYLRQADYTRKTQEVAQARKEADQAIAQQVQIVQTLAGEIGEFQALQNQVAAYSGVDWDALEREDPAAAAQHFRKFQTLKEKAQAAAAKVQYARQQFDQTQQQAFIQGVQEAEQRLTEKVKGITRDEVVKTFATLQKMGADQKTIDLVRSNPALAEAVIYANRYMELQDKKPQIAQKAKALPPVTVKARPADVKTSGEQIIKAIQSKRTFAAGDFAKLLARTK